MNRAPALWAALRRPFGCSGIGIVAMVGLLAVWEYLAPDREPNEYPIMATIMVVLSAVLIPTAFAFAIESARHLWRLGRRALCGVPIALLPSCVVGFPFAAEALTLSRLTVMWSFFAGLAASLMISAALILRMRQ
jgi:hypothetical protein